jgi:hypothetical protein
MFELSFRDERYLPFEFAGAVSHWRIELPPENNWFDLDTISDVVLHLNYTAREGGDVLRRAANEVAQKHLPGNGLRFFDMKREFPEEWYRFQGRAEEERSPRKLELRLNHNMFPYIPCHKNFWIHQIHVFFETRRAEPHACRTIELLIGHMEKEEGEREYTVHNIHCASSVEWPCIYHGVIDITLGPLGRIEKHVLGTLKFPPDIREVTRAFLICGYSTMQGSFKEGEHLSGCFESKREQRQ